ncbi:hypothetical protein SESBI_14922 [Sesbania bispinosa]|nr:hypothetical protein SESBI_14922 [Sesbania bispinosa]
MGVDGAAALHVATAEAERSATVGESGRAVVAGGVRLHTSGKGAASDGGAARRGRPRSGTDPRRNGGRTHRKARMKETRGQSWGRWFMVVTAHRRDLL